MEKDTLMNLVPQTTEEKLLWEREQNKALVKENRALARSLKAMSKEFVDYKKEVEKHTVPQMLEKLNKVKSAHANMEIEYKRIVNANKGFMEAAIQKSIDINKLKEENLDLLYCIAELKKQIEALEKPSFLSIFKRKK